ncbi:MAG: thioesterase family protein [Jiangellaceae bacterium]
MSLLQEGQQAERPRVVETGDTATALGSGDVPVLATPRLLAWLEAATVMVVDGRLDEGSTSVGTRVELEHLAPSPVGKHVAVRAELAAVDGRRLEFDIEARHDDGTVVARGRLARMVVDRSRFIGSG